MTLGRIAWLTGWLATAQLIATSVHAADTKAPDRPTAPPQAAEPPPPGAAQPVPSPGAVPPPPPALAPFPAGPVVYLKSSNAVTELQLRTVDGWDTVCVAPCNQRLDPMGAYRVNGPGLRPSQAFNVPPSGSLHLDVSPGSAPSYWAGLGMTLGGLGTMGYGLLLYGVASSTSTSCSGYDNYCTDPGNTVRGLGTGILVVGGIVTLIGALLWLQNSTQVEMR
jgi:hypothetical protein